METDIGNPIEYDPLGDREKNEDSTPITDHSIQEQPYYFHPSEMYPPQQQYQPEKVDIFANIEKTTWIIAFAVFLLGFFMWKTMQPVILRYT